MAYKTPPLRAPFFEWDASLPAENPNLPGTPVLVKFLRTTREWATWASNMAKGLGSVSESRCVVATLDFANMAAGASDDQTVTVEGVKANDAQPVVNIGVGSFTAGLIFQGFVSADDTVTVRCTNASTGAINPASADYRVEVRRY